MLQRIARNYVKVASVPIWQYDALNIECKKLINVEQHKQFLEDNKEFITPGLLCQQLSCIASLGLLLDEHWPPIVQHIKEDMATWDRHCPVEFYRVGRYLGLMKEVNEEFWTQFETKLLDEGLMRYMTEWQCAGLLRALATAGKGSPELFEKLESYVRKHAMALDENDVAEMVEALEISGRGSVETMEVLRMHPKFPQAMKIRGFVPTPR